MAATPLEFADPYALGVVLVGLGLLAVATLLRALCGRIPSFPTVLLLAGAVLWSLPLGLPSPDPREHGDVALHLTELCVIVSLMGVGLKIDRAPRFRTWGTTWRLLAITMPLTIIAVALLGWWAIGLAPAAALLLGAVLAPTDPVLAADVQVAEPLEGLDERWQEEPEEELRFALTSEAGLNDALAFPFTYLAILVHQRGLDPSGWLQGWVLVDVLYRLSVGVVVGALVGMVLAVVLLRISTDTERDRGMTGVGALAATLLLYGITEALEGYGFMAVVIGALVIRHRESRSTSHVSLHLFAEQAEQMLLAVVLLLLGGAVATGLLDALTPASAMVGLALVLVVRPVAGMLALLGSPRIRGIDRPLASFFGIRGVGSLFYLAYAFEAQPFAESRQLWSTVAFTIVVSVLLHGQTAPFLMRWRDRRREHGGAAADEQPSAGHDEGDGSDRTPSDGQTVARRR